MAIGSNTGKAMARKGIGPALPEIAAVECEQPLPVPLGGVAVVDRAFWKGKAVMRAGIDFDLVARALHGLLHLVDDFLRRVDVGFRAGEIDLGFGLACCEMRAVRLVGR